MLVRALKHLSEEIHLLLIGDGPLDAVLRTMASEMGVAQRVHMLGYKKREEIYSLLRKSHCFVLSSIHEGLGIVVQEAMDAGLPVVSTDNGGQVDLIKQGRNGLLVKIGDDKALAVAIQTVYRDRTLAETMGRNNLADIRSLYIENNSKLYLELFREVTGETEVQTISVHKENETELIGAGR